ncbi:MAG: extracellular solute-binding protein, partial [Thermomicrobiales bacterium]
KALFDEAGQAYPTDDWTWDQYKSVSQEISATLKDKGVFGTALPIDDPQAGYYNSIPQAGGEVISADGSTSGFDSPNSIRGLELWSDLIASGASPDVQQLADTLPVSWFTSGKAAMIWSGSYNASSIAESEFADSIDLVRLPHDETSATVLNGLSNVVAASSENKEAAQTFQNFLGSKEAAEIGAKDGVVIPAFNGTQADWVQTRPEWNLQVFIDAVEDGVPFPRSLNSPVWEKYATDLLPAAWSGSRPVAEVANELADKMNAALAAEK